MRVKRLPVSLAFAATPLNVRQIADALAHAIAQGRLAPDEPLPSSRDLAAQLSVARNTVLRAVAQLADAGWVETRPGVGTFVKPLPARGRVAADRTDFSFELTDWARRLPESTNLLDAATSVALDFRPGIPDLRSIPFVEWRRSAARKLRTLRANVASYGDPQGDEELRLEISRYVARSRGVACRPANVIVTSGAQQAFDLIARVLLKPGSKVALEDPGYWLAALTFAASGAELRGIAVDEDGLDVARLPRVASMVYVTPAHQFPLGVTMSGPRRRELLAWAARCGAFIVEDDYDSEYRYGGEALPALQSEHTDRVLYVGTFSKSFMPGIRLGYLVVPQTLRAVFRTAKWLTDRHCDNVSQAVLAEFMASGQFARHLARMRAVYAERHACLMRYRDELSRLGAKLLTTRAGLHVCVLLRADDDEAGFIRAAARSGLGFYGLRSTFLGRAQPGLILGFGNLDARGIDAGMTQLLRLLAKPSRAWPALHVDQGAGLSPSMP